MIILELNWEAQLRKLNSSKEARLNCKDWYTRTKLMPKSIKSSINARIKEINKMILAGTAIYREAPEKFYTVKDNTTGQEFTYPTMEEAQKRQEDLIHIIGHDAEVL